jgi:uncharacterized protein YbaP (TraB family)
MGDEMNLFWWKEKRLKTVWKIEKEGKTSFLVGTAHFSPYRFGKTLTKLIRGADLTLFEGPLDQESMDRVVQYGRQAENTPSVYQALNPAAIKEINEQLGARSSSHALSTAVSCLDLVRPTTSDFLELHTHGVRPWMAFFTVWSAFLNWKHSMDMEAFHIARKLGREIQYLETIEDQLEALDGIPFDRIVNYLNHFSHWEVHKELYLKAFLEGDLPKFFSMTGEFPTRCDSILTKRDPIFFERIKSFFPKGKTVAFVGVAHIPGIRKMFLDEGYQVTQEER